MTVVELEGRLNEKMNNLLSLAPSARSADKWRDIAFLANALAEIRLALLDEASECNQRGQEIDERVAQAERRCPWQI